jgi:hypothetical protein
MSEGPRDIIPPTAASSAGHANHDMTVVPGPTESYRLNADEVGALSAAITKSLANMNNPMFATKEQTEIAKKAAAVTTAALGEALTADPDAYDKTLAAYRGPIHTMSHHATMMHMHLTGHNLPEADFPADAPYERAMSALHAIGSRAVDGGLDYLGSGGATNATAAYARKGIAMQAGRALSHIVETRGGVTVSEPTLAAMAQLMTPSQAQY